MLAREIALLMHTIERAEQILAQRWRLGFTGLAASRTVTGLNQMRFLAQVTYDPPSGPDRERYPFNVPIVQSLQTLELTTPVTIFVGENGSGKSTLLEAIAAATNLATVGAESVSHDPSLAPARRLGKRLKLSWRRRTHHGFFVRSEDFFGFARRMTALRAELERDLDEVEAQHHGEGPNYGVQPFARELRDMRRLYGEDLDARSHGESYFKLFGGRFVPDGLYLMDEPEAPLSPTKQLSLIALIKLMVEEQNAQFIISTHSPMLMACPHSTIIGFDDGTLRTLAWEDVEHVRVMRGFLERREQFLRYL